MRTAEISSSGENAVGSEGYVHPVPKKRLNYGRPSERRCVRFNYPLLNEKLFLRVVTTPTFRPMVPDRFPPDEKDGISIVVSRINMRLYKSRADVWLQERIPSKRDRTDKPGPKRAISKFGRPVSRKAAPVKSSF